MGAYLGGAQAYLVYGIAFIGGFGVYLAARYPAYFPDRPVVALGALFLGKDLQGFVALQFLRAQAVMIDGFDITAPGTRQGNCCD